MAIENILVTGSTGFLGDALVKTLYQNKNNRIVCIERDPSPIPGFKPVKVLRGDLCDYDFVRRVIADEEINRIYHCAANSIVRSCANDPLTAYEINVLATVKLLEAVRTVGMSNIRSIVISTSDKAMGHAPSPYTESSPLMPKYTYEATKSCQDIVAQNYFHNYGLPINIMRCSNIYGPGDPNLSRIIPNTIRQLIAGNKPMLFNGVANYIREFVYIDDVVEAFVLVANTAPNGEIYCVGGTERLRVRDLIEKIKTLMNKEIETEYRDRDEKFKEIEEQYIDASKLKELGWKPEVDLFTGLSRTIYYYGRDYFHGDM